ncbi:autotransporter BatB [Bordetella bronchiseptica]
MRRLKAQAFEGRRSRPAGHGVAPTLLALALGFQGTAAWANCTTSGSSTTCTSANGSHTNKVGSGPSGMNERVTVNQGARIETNASAAISVGTSGQVRIEGGAVVQSTVNTAASGQYAKTLEAASTNNISIQEGAQLLAKGSAQQSSALGLSGAGNTVTNRGTIRADNAAAIWVTANTANAANTIDNYGTIETVLNGGYANAIGSTRNNSATGAGVTVRNHANGRIVGNVKFEAGDDSVILDGGSTITGSLNGGSGNNSLTLKAGDGTLGRAIRNFGTITKQDAGTWTLNGKVGGNDNNLKSTVKVEGGTLALRGDNSGATQGGVLQVSAGATADVTAASAMQSVSNAGTVQFTQDRDAVYAGVLSGAGNIIKRGSGDLALTGNNTHTGKLVVEAGKLSVSEANNLGGASSSVQLKGGALALKKTIVVNRGLTLDPGAQTLIIEPGTTTTWQGQVTGSGKLVTQGGTLVLEHASNTYSGGTEINNGTLRAAHDASLGSGTLALKSSQLAATDSFTATRALTLAGNESIDVAATKILSWNGEISGAGTLVKEGQGTLLLRGTNQQSGGTVVNAGTLQISRDANLGRGTLELNNGTLQSTGSFGTTRAATLRGQAAMEVGASHTVIWHGDLSGGGMLRKTGYGTLVLAGNNTYSGGTVVEAGALQAGHEDNLGRGGITLSGGELLAGGSFSSNRDLRLTQGAVDVVRDATLTWSGAISGAGDLVKTGGGTLALTGVNEYAGQTVLRQGKLRVAREESLGRGALVLENNTVFESAGSYAIGRRVTLKGAPKVATPAGDTLEWRGTVDGDGKLYKQGGGTLVLSGNNTYAKGVEVWGGVVQVSRDQNLGAANGAVTLNGGGLAVNGDFTSNRQLELTAGAKAIDVAAGKDVTWRGLVNGAGALTKTGDGTLALAGANTYTGGTRLQGGTVQVSRDNNLGQAAGAVTFDGGRLASTGSFATARTATLNKAGQIDTAQGTTLTWNGAIGGKGELRKQGAGTLVLGGANTYQGDTRVEAGTLQVSADTNLGQGAVHLHDSRLATTGTFATSRRLELTGRGAVQAAAAATLDWRGTVAGAGTLVKEGAGTLVLAGDNQHAGGTEVRAGTLQVSRATNLGPGALALENAALATTASFTATQAATLTGNAAIDTAAGTTLGWEGAIGGTGSLHKKGGGKLVLVKDNHHDGGTTIHAGTLQVSRDANLGSGQSAVTLDGGALAVSAGFSSGREIVVGAGHGALSVAGGHTLQWQGQVGGAGALTKTGDGTLVLEHDNTHAGGTRVTGGVLRVSRDENLGEAHGMLTLDGGTLSTTAGFASRRNATVGNGSGRIVVADAATLDLQGDVAGAGRLVKEGAGTLALGGTNTYAGGTVVEAGTLRVARDANLGGGALTLNNSRLHATAGFATGRNATLSGRASIETDDRATLQWRGTVDGAGRLVKQGLGTLVLDGDNRYAGGTEVNAGTLQVARDANLGAGDVALNGSRLAATASFATARTATLSGAAAIDTADGATLDWNGLLDGDGVLVKQGNGTLALAAANRYGGGTIVKAGAVRIARDANLGRVGTGVTLDGGALATTADLATDRAATLGAANGTLDVAAGTRLDWNGAIGGAGALTKTGAGTLALNHDNQHAGGTLVHGGTLRIARDANLGAAGTAVTLDGGTLATTASLAPERALRVGAGNGVLLPDAGTTLDWRGVVAGAGKLTKAGPGTLVLSADNRHGGGTAVTGGTLQVSRDANLGAAAGALTLDGGTLLSTASFASARAATLDAAGGTFVTRDGTRLDWDGAIGGAGGLVKDGAGELRLGNANTYQGPTRIAAGRLAVNGSIASPVTVEQAGVLGGTGRIVGDVANRGVVAPGNSIGALTVAGNYAGTGGSLEVEAVLGGDAAPADRLVLDGGAASGVTPVVVKPQGGVGGLTLRGIPVVVAQSGATTAPGAFRLAQPLVAGAYEYQLLRGAGDGAAAQAQDWYLRTSRVERDKAGRIVKVVPFYRPEVALYAGTPMLMRMVGTEALGSYRERAGQPGAAAPEAGAAARRGVWARTFGRRFERSAGSEAAPSFNGSLAGMQLGADLYTRRSATRHADAFGVFGGYATARGDVRGLARGEIQAVGTSTLRAAQLGAYWTHTGPSGWYVDTVLAGTRYKQQTSSSAHVGATSRGWGMMASVEAGYPWQLNPRWQIEPQAQLVYQQLGIANGADRVSSVSYKTPDALTGRLGTRLAGQYAYGKAQLRPFMGVSLLHDFTGADTVTFAGVHSVRASRQNTAVDLKAGVDTQLGKSVGLWGQVGYGKSVGSGDGSDRGWSANLGLRVAY